MERMMTIALICVFMAYTGAEQDTQPKPEAKSQSVPAVEAAPTADQILEKYVAVIGGRAVVEKLTSRVMRGSLVTSAGNAPIEVYEKAPNRFLVIIDSPVSGKSQNAYDGAVAWSQNTQRGLREMSGPEVENFKREYDLHREIRLKEFYPRMTVKGRVKIGDSEANVIEALTAEGLSEAMYFDLITGLLVRRDVTIQGSTLEAYFEDYREVDGIKIPFTVRRSRPGFSFTYKFDEVRHNVAIEDARFNKPVAQ